MRPDMGKVVTERPRGGSRGRSKVNKGYYKRMHKFPLDEQPKTENSRQRFGGIYPHFTDVLGPLRGYVQSVIGRKFDEVYGEIKKSLPGNSMSAIHAIGHLWQYLERHVVIDECGRPCYPETRYRFYGSPAGLVPIEGSRFGTVAYVDPRDGIIKAAPQRESRKQRTKPELTRFWLRDVLYEKIDGIWYQIAFRQYIKIVRMEPAIPGDAYKYIQRPVTHLVGGYDVVLGSNVQWLTEHRLKNTHGRAGVYAYKKTQLNKRELKRLGLQNGSVTYNYRWRVHGR